MLIYDDTERVGASANTRVPLILHFADTGLQYLDEDPARPQFRHRQVETVLMKEKVFHLNSGR